ncbi:DNA primase [Lacinutrix sp. Hel_I_90]|uniref:DNA primase n=1 Tax=Lacinutrix sp. Hel_I_90 TaxID=1249999 RepID=UPI000697FC83|nr:DNA primase [Lacinutrix sp. Hel_I_90]
MRYTASSIDIVREADIVKTIENFVSLKKVAANYKCNSPFTNEKTPSFTVSPVKQIFKCFSSGLGGDGIKFVMQHERVEFVGAVEIIAKIHNIHLEKEEVTPDVQRKMDQKSEMYNVTEKAARSFFNAYKKLPDNHWAKVLIADREFNEESILAFQIGFNGDDNKLTKWSIEHGSLAVSKELGLSKTKDNSSYDIFRNRIMFPIHNEKGTVVGFGGRQSNDPKLDKSFKYINSKESLIYDKSSVLYGLFQAKHIIAKMGTAILTEGYTDVIAMHKNGCENTIASCGTALTERHAQLINKYAQEVVLLRDGDKAGLKTMLKKGGDIDICLSHGLNVSICILPDGEDPDTFSRAQLDMGTWIDNNKHDAVLYKVSQFDLIRDRYETDVEDIKKTSKLQIKAVEDLIVDTKDLEGKELTDAKAFNKGLSGEISDIKKETTNELREIQQIDPTKKALAVNEIADMLFKIKHEVKREEYIKQIAKTLKVSTAAIKAEIGKFEVKATEEKDKDKDSGKLSMRGIQLPEGANKEEYLEGHGFVTVGNSYHFQRLNTNTFFQGTTFKLEPLFHILGDKENTRLCELTNIKNQKRLIDFDTDMLASFNDFRKYIFKLQGLFMFLTHNGFRTEHFDKFVYRFEEQFEPALELLTMGWNTKGFYAFANGVYWEGKFRGVNKYGIMNLEGIDKTESDYNQKIDNYYSPAFSVMHIDNQEGDDKYENDRYFVYKESSITLNDWMQQMIVVFKEKGIVGTLFNFGAIFRDLFLKHYDSFPLMGGFGEKDSGKSGFGKILQNFFYYRLPPVDLTQVTHVGLSRRLSRNTNTVQFGDEYQDRTVKEEVGNLLMGAWNGIGREKGNGVGSTRTSLDKINSAVYYAGQFMPTFKENALATRTISNFFITRNFSPQEKTDFNKLLNWTNAGISSLVVDVVQHRTYFEKRLPLVHAETERELKQLLGNEQYQERIFGNVSMLYTTYAILKDKLDFPFTEKEVQKLCIELIINNSEQIADSNGLTEFWNIITFLFEQGRIKLDNDFAIRRDIDFKILGEKRKEIVHKNEKGDQILYLRLKSVYQFYNKEASTREGVDVIGQTTIRHYFKSRPEFIGLVKGHRFGKAGTQSCYAFNYTMMVKKGLVTLEEDLSEEDLFTPAEEETTEVVDF